jgi:DNA-binding helix-hairpin-helix protein with protein kinase domain
MRVALEDGTTEDYEDEPFNDGGQGRLYLSRDRKHVIKLYHREDRARLPALRKIMGELNVTRDDPSAVSLFAWINGIAIRPSLGVRMRNVNYEMQHKDLTWWLSSKSFKKIPEAMRGDWFDRTCVASELARIAWKLHGVGLCHSDFSGNNFLVNVARRRAVLIDLDGLVVPDVLPPIMIGTTDYMAPEIVAAQMRGIRDIRPSIQTDLHSLAVLIYQLLLMRHPLRGPKVHDPKNPERDEQLALGEKALYTEDPDDRSNRPEDPFRGAWLLGEEVESLMRRAFTDGLRDPSKRPIAAAWHEALMRMADQHVPCFNPACEGKAFILLRDHPAVCPWCNTRITFPKQIPVLRLYASVGQTGHFQQDKGRVVVWRDRTLHRWHVQSGFAEHDAKSDEERVALIKFEYDGRQGWVLHNLGLEDLRVADINKMQRVALGAKALLREGQKWLLGAGNAARLALVTMQSV